MLFNSKAFATDFINAEYLTIEPTQIINCRRCCRPVQIALLPSSDNICSSMDNAKILQNGNTKFQRTLKTYIKYPLSIIIECVSISKMILNFNLCKLKCTCQINLIKPRK